MFLREEKRGVGVGNGETRGRERRRMHTLRLGRRFSGHARARGCASGGPRTLSDEDAVPTWLRANVHTTVGCHVAEGGGRPARRPPSEFHTKSESLESADGGSTPRRRPAVSAGSTQVHSLLRFFIYRVIKRAESADSGQCSSGLRPRHSVVLMRGVSVTVC